MTGGGVGGEHTAGAEARRGALFRAPADRLNAAAMRSGTLGDMDSRGAIHHLELWVSDIEAADASLGWLLHALGYELADTWPVGRSWRLGDAYIVLESGPDVLAGVHERRRPGLNHLAFHAGSEREVDELTAEAIRHGWKLLFADRHPHAGGPAQYAAYLEDDGGFEVELVAFSS